MAGISLSVEGDKIQLSFQKDDQATAILMDASAARTLAAALTQLLAVMAMEGEDLEEGDEDEGEEVVDVTSPTIDIGLDEMGQPVLSLQAGSLPPFLLRLKDDEARHIAESLSEILNAPRDARVSQGGH